MTNKYKAGRQCWVSYVAPWPASYHTILRKSLGVSGSLWAHNSQPPSAILQKPTVASDKRQTPQPCKYY